LIELLGIVIVASLLVFTVGSYIIWPSRWNIPAHIGLGFCIVTYAIPVLILKVYAKYPDYLLRFYVQILALGAACYLAGLLLGGRAPWEKLLRWKLNLDVMPQNVFDRLVCRRTVLLMTLGLAGMAVAFYMMGFLPIFAADPFAAKFFRGAYQWRSPILAGLYRLSYKVIETLIPVGFAAWYANRRTSFLVLSGLGVLCMALVLTRGPVVVGFLAFWGLVAAKKKSWFRAYFIFVVLIFPLGSASYYILGNLFGIHQMFSIYKTDTLWGVIAEGAPDITDHIDFLIAFYAYGDFTHGRTFWGGLLPGNYRWNPAVWSVSLQGGGMNRANIAEIASGGLRLPVAIWGYTAFEWYGVVFVSFLSGLMNGIATSFTKRRVDGRDVLRSIVVLTLYNTLWNQLTNFYLLSSYSIPSILVALLLVWYGKVALPARRELSSRSPQAVEYSRSAATKFG
jgi:hypothetical protein